jgi:CheY-like chemotaxis protein
MANPISLSGRALDLEPVVKDFARELRRKLPSRIFLKLEWRRGCRPVKAELAQIRLILSTLADFSRESMPDGGRLHIWLAGISFGERDEPPVAGMPPGPWAVLAVSDTGIGIEPESITKEFDGPKLATVRETAQALGGYVEFSSSVGQGTTFTVYIPAISASAFAGSSKTVLLVDDDPETLDVGRRMIESLGYRVATAVSAAAALETWTALRPDIAAVVTDLTMPGMSGLDLFKALRDRDAAVRVVVASGFAFQEIIEQSGLQGLAGWLEKPYQLDRLDAALARALA